LRRDSISALTTREVQILDLIFKGTQNKIIADKLHLSENTVKVHVSNNAFTLRSSSTKCS
ncbi:response regulator transcription factor, partial [Rhizobium johnstonii]